MNKFTMALLAMLSVSVISQFSMAESHSQKFSQKSQLSAEIKRGSQHRPVNTAGAFATESVELKDTYCHDNKPGYSACDAKFKQKCSGSMSGKQGWGGQTCFTRSGGIAVE